MDIGERYAEDALKDLEKRFKATYSQASDTAKERFLSEMKKFTEEDEKRRAAFEKGDISKTEYEAWRKKAILPAAQNANLYRALSAQMTEANERARAALDGRLAGIFAENANYAFYKISKDINVIANFTLYDETTVNRLIKDGDLDLLPKEPNKKKDIRWNNQRISSEITQGILLGEPILKISKRLESISKMNANNAIRNARTAITSAQNAGRLESYHRAENMGIKIKKKWVATLDNRTRDSHVSLDGETVDIDQPFSNGLQYPGDPSGAPGEVYNCRCTMITEIEGFPHDMTQRFSRLNGMSYEEWKQRGQL